MTFIIIAIIVVLIVVGISVSAIMQYKEEQKAERKRKIAKFRYRAREGQDIYEQYFDLPVGHEAKVAILQYVAQNLSRALEVDSGQADVKETLSFITSKMSSPESLDESSNFNYPNDPYELVAMMGRIKKLIKYLNKLAKIPGVDPTNANQGILKSKQMHINLKSLSFIIVGQQAMSGGKWSLAKQHFGNAQKVLLQQNITSDISQSRLQQLEALMHEADQKQQQEFEKMNQSSSVDIDEEFDEEDSDFAQKRKW